MLRPGPIVGAAVAAALAAGGARAEEGAGRVAAWVVRTAVATPEGVDRALAAARRAGLDPLVVQVRGRGDAYYESRFVPRAEALAAAPAGFDPLARVLAGRGSARVLAWMNVYLLWSGDQPPTDLRHAARDRWWTLRDADGRPVTEYSALDRSLGWIEGVYADPAAPGYRQHFATAAAELAGAYPVDGVHLDYLRYPGPGYGQGGSLGEAFQVAWGLDPRWIPEELRTPDLGAWLGGAMPLADRVLATAALLWAEARAGQVTEAMRSVRAALHGVRPGLELSAAVYPDAGPAFLEKGQDWRTWAEEGLVDALYPMVYFGGAERVEAQLASLAALARAAAPGIGLWAGLGAYLKAPEVLTPEARAAWRLGYDGVCLFDLGGLEEKPGGAEAFTQAVRAGFGPGAAPAPPPAAAPGAGPGGRALGRAVERAAGGAVPPVADLAGALEARWAEFEGVRAEAVPRVLTRLAERPLDVPAWAELRGVYRFVHPLDGAEKREAQRRAAEAARARVVKGEAFDAVARGVSQGGSKAQGGALGRRYLLPGSPANDALLALKPGQVSPVVETPNGYWVYRCEARGAAAKRPLPEVPWDARRIAFRRELAAELARGGAAR